MKIIVWKLEDITKRSDSSRRQRVTAVWVSPRGKTKWGGSMEFSFMSEFQSLCELLKRDKVLPAAAFERHDNGAMRHGSRDGMREARFAHCIQL